MPEIHGEGAERRQVAAIKRILFIVAWRLQLFLSGDGPAGQRLAFLRTPKPFVNERKAVQVIGDVGMVWPKPSLVRSEHALADHFGVGITTEFEIQGDERR